MKHDFDKIVERRNTHCLKWDDNKRVFGREDVLPLWVADMDFEAPPAVIEALRTRVDHGIFGYSIKSDEYYASIIDWIKKRHDWDIHRAWIVSAPGVVPSLNLCIMAYSAPGDKILVQSPVYYPFFAVIENNNRAICNNPLILKNGQYEMDFNDLETKLQTGVKLMIFCNPHNPGGRVWSKSDVERVSTLCRQYGTILISDEIHSDLIYSGNTHYPAAALSEENSQNTITCFAPSKTFNLAGLAASYAIIPNSSLRAAYKRAMQSIGGDMSNVFGEIGLTAAYTYGDEWLRDVLTYLKGNLDEVLHFFKTYLPDISVIKPQGTYLVWLDCRGLGLSHRDLMEIMVHKAGVGLSSGAVFGQGGEGFLRLNIACPKARLLDGLHKIWHALYPK